MKYSRLSWLSTFKLNTLYFLQTDPQRLLYSLEFPVTLQFDASNCCSSRILGLLNESIKICSPSISEHFFFFLMCFSPTRATANPFTRFLDHTQRRTTVGRTPLDEWSPRRRDYLTTQNAHKRQTSVPPAGFKPTISGGERPQTYALGRAVTGTNFQSIHPRVIKLIPKNIRITDTKQLESKQG